MEVTKKNHDVSVKYFFNDKKFAGVDPGFEVFGITDGIGMEVVHHNRKKMFSKLNEKALAKKITFLNDWITNMIFKQKSKYSLYPKEDLIDEDFLKSAIEFV